MRCRAGMDGKDNKKLFRSWEYLGSCRGFPARAYEHVLLGSYLVDKLISPGWDPATAFGPSAEQDWAAIDNLTVQNPTAAMM